MFPIASTDGFELFGSAHLTVIALTFLAPIVLSVSVRTVDRRKFTQGVCIALAIVLLLNEWTHYTVVISTEGFSKFVHENLPLHVCDLAIYLGVFVLFTRNLFAYETAYFWAIAGTLQAVITPEMPFTFPNYHWIRFFITHSGIVTVILFATWGLQLRPTFRSVWRTFLISNVWMLIVAGINVLLGANYMYLCQAPETANPLFFLDWPWYILLFEPLAIVIFLIVYAPFPFTDWIRNKFRQRAAKQQ